MSIEHQQPESKPSLEHMMRELHPQWEELPEGERGQLMVQWLQDFLKTDKAQPIRRELGLEADYYYKPTNGVAKEDLLSERPDLAAKIETADEIDLIDYVADKVGDALQEMYWVAVSDALDEYFKPENKS
jgi:hypothetical protein